MTQTPVFSPGTLVEPWDRFSVASLVTGAAAGNPHGGFIADCPERLAWNGAEPRRLTFGEFHRRANFFGAQLVAMGLKPGERVMILLPNSVDWAVSVIGCLIAGFVPALAAIDESVEALRGAAERAGIAAIVTTDRVETLPVAEKARQVAARAMCVRMIAGFGAQLPEGVTPFDGWSEEDVSALPAQIQGRQSAEALITFALDGGALSPLVRSEGQLIADALALAAAAPVERAQPLVSLLQPGSAVQLAAGLLLPLFVGADLRLVGPFSEARFAATMAAAPRAVLLAPGRFLVDLADAGAELPFPAPMRGIALVRPASAEAMRELPGPVTWCLDLDGRGLLIRADWPEAGLAGFVGRHAHPMDNVLPAGEAYIALEPTPSNPFALSGFGVARPLARPSTANAA